MANLFNSNPLMGLGLALSTFGGQESLGGAINLLNYAQRQQLIDEERRKEEVQNIAASTLLKNAGAVGSPKYRKRTFTPNPEDAALGVNPVTFGSDAPAQNLLSSSMETGLLAKAIGPQNLLSMKMASEAEASKPRELAAGAILTNSKGDILARNNKPPEIPSEAALVKYYQSLPDGPEKAQLGAIIQQKTQGQQRVTWTRLTPQEAAQANLPEGGVYEVSSDGQTRAVTTPSRDPGTLKLKEVENAAAPLLSALNDFEREVNNSTFWDRANAAAGGTSKEGKSLNSAWTNAALMAKGEALFNLGVLAGPDLDILRNALTDPSTITGLRTGKTAYRAGINNVRKLVQDRLAAARQTYGGNSPAPASPQPSGTAGWSIVRVK